MGLTKVEHSNTIYELWLNGGRDMVHVDIGEHFLDEREQDFIAFYDKNMMIQFIKYTDLLLLVQLAKEWRNCEHDWIDMTNPPIITGGWWCSKCNRVKGELDDVEE
jgi:hypothetical protein